MPKDWGQRTEPQVVFLGEVDEAEAFLSDIDVLLSPVLSGGGMRIKILEGLAMEKAMVSTHIGAEGIPVQSGVHIMLADQPEAFAQAILTLLQEPERGPAMGKAGREMVIAHYESDKVVQTLLDFYATLRPSES